MRHTGGILVLLVAVLAAGDAWGAKPSKRLSDEAKGRLLYERHCIQCHGPDTAGDGPATEALVVEVPDLTGQVVREERDQDAELVLDGHGGMPSFLNSFDLYDARRIMRHMYRLSHRSPEAADATEPEVPEAEEPNTDDARE
ncbi:MAG: cytochrome c [Deltaproteobacteria bacterium]|nr:cytochrome c [Deltaproteobacteria bacterium]MBW2253634.1 cytochrome c [Deltaproteobacteria bacterium]